MPHPHLSRFAASDDAHSAARISGAFDPPEILILGSSRAGRAIDAPETTSLLRQARGDATVRIFDAAVPAGAPILMNRLADDLLLDEVAWTRSRGGTGSLSSQSRANSARETSPSISLTSSIPDRPQ